MAREMLSDVTAAHVALLSKGKAMSENTKKEMTSLSLEDLDVKELEERIELAANAAGCDCNGGCGSHCGSHACKPQ